VHLTGTTYKSVLIDRISESGCLIFVKAYILLCVFYCLAAHT
jgi:hypothetical protein